MFAGANYVLRQTPAKLVAPAAVPALGELVRSNVSHASGKYYFEMMINAATNLALVGVGVDNGVESLNGVGGQAGGILWLGNGNVVYDGLGIAAAVQSFNVGDVVGVAVDVTDALIWFRDAGGNWSNNGSANPATGAGGLSIAAVTPNVYAVAQLTDALDEITANFAGPFTYTAPSGFGNF